MKKTIFAVVSLIAAFPVFADYNSALNLFSQGKYEESLKIIGQELDASLDMTADSPNYKLRFLAAHNHWKMKRYENAMSHIGRCLQIKPDDTNAMIDAGLIYSDWNKFKDALRIGQKLAEKEKNNPAGYYLIGKARYGLENYWGAKELYEKATSIDFNFYPAWNELGKTLMMLKKYPEAEIAFSTALSIKPGSYEVMNNLAACYYTQGQKEKATEMLKKAAEAGKSNAVIQENLASVSK